MKVLFVNSKGIEREIAEVSTKKEATDEIVKFCTDRNFEVHYMRGHKVENTTVIDVGSHTEHFLIVE